MLEFVLNVLTLQVIAVCVFQMVVFFSANRKLNTLRFLGMTAVYSLTPFVGIVMIAISAIMAFRGVADGWAGTTSIFEQIAEGYE